VVLVHGSVSVPRRLISRWTAADLIASIKVGRGLLSRGDLGLEVHHGLAAAPEVDVDARRLDGDDLGAADLATQA
jgi:hypothetical protein